MKRQRKMLMLMLGLMVLLALAIGLYGQDSRTGASASERILASSIEMVRVNGGTFMMGCTPEQSDDCYSAEKPAHRVTVNTFEIGKYEITQAQWRAVMGTNPSNFKGDDLPVERVNWNDIQEFIRKLNKQTGEKYRLPTEAEWEFAARGGGQSRGYKYSGGNYAGDVAWYGDNSGEKTHTVGQKQANELGLYDMSGNVWEWVQDLYDLYNGYSVSERKNPLGAQNGSYHVVRGGGWYNDAWDVRVSVRDDRGPGFRLYNLGFRLARDAREKQARAARENTVYAAYLDGKAEERSRIVRNALKKNMSIEDIADLAGLTVEEVRNLIK